MSNPAMGARTHTFRRPAPPRMRVTSAAVQGPADEPWGPGLPLPGGPGPTGPRNKPLRVIPGVVVRVIDGIGVAVPAGMERLFIDVTREAQR